jgi:hypothetical protein
LLKVGSKISGPRGIFGKELARRMAAAEDMTSGLANMTANKQLKFQIHVSDTKTEATS